jgi:hypothetical protein
MMAVPHRILCCLLACGLTVGAGAIPRSVQAQTPEEIEQAKAKFREGKEHYDAEEYDQAAARFLEAYELSGRVELLYNIGQSHRLAGNLREAEKYLQEYLSESPDAPNADQVVQTIVELQQKIAGQLATVQVETAESGRSVYVDDEAEPRCETPCSVTVPPGQRRITLKAEGYQDLVEEIALEPGKTFQLKTQLQELIVPGRLMLTTDRPGGRLRVGGVVETTLPLRQPLELEPGDYPVEVESARNAKWKGQIRIEPKETTEVLVPMQSLVEARKRGSLRKSIAYGLWGVSVASAIGAGLMGGQTQSIHAELEAQQQARNYVDESLVNRGRTQLVLTNVMFGVAATAVVSGIALFVWDEFATEKEPDAPAPKPTEELTER